MKNIIKTACLAFLLGDICSYAIATQAGQTAQPQPPAQGPTVNPPFSMPEMNPPMHPPVQVQTVPQTFPRSTILPLSGSDVVVAKLSDNDTLPEAQFLKTKNFLREISSVQLKDFPYTVKLDVSGLPTQCKVIKSPYSFCDELIEIQCGQYAICLPLQSSKCNLQPPIELAAILSCANVKDERITDAYMQLFGLKEFNGSVVGLIKNEKTLYPIIQLYLTRGVEDQLFDYLNIETLSTNEASEFIENFRKIASSPVGRVLLYRILIELLRYNVDNGEYCDSAIESRPHMRGIWIGKCKQQDADAFCSLGVNKLQSIIRLSPKLEANAVPVKLSTVTLDGFNVNAADVNSSSDITLFHEMLHWFHNLQSARRQNQLRSHLSTYPSYEWKAYYGDIPVDLLAWGNIRVEELMTIAGKPDYNDYEILKYLPEHALRQGYVQDASYIKRGYIVNFEKFFHGDELSENAYRLMKKISGDRHILMRWGHGSVEHTIKKWDNGTQRPDCLDMITRIKLADVVATRCVTDIVNAGQVGYRPSIYGFLNY